MKFGKKINKTIKQKYYNMKYDIENKMKKPNKNYITKKDPPDFKIKKEG